MDHAMNHPAKPGRRTVRAAEALLARSQPGLPHEPSQGMLLVQQVGQLWKQMLADSHDLLREARLTPVTYATLLVLYHAQDGVMTPSALAACTGEQPTNVSRICNELEALQLIRRSRSENDRRNVELSLTARGLAQMDALLPRLQERAERTFSILSLSEKNLLERLQKKILAHAGQPAG